MARPGRAAGSKSDDLADKASGAACSLASRLGVTNRFVPGTLVLMADGSRKKIENLRAGEYVLAKDAVTGRSGARKVTDVRTKISLRTMVELTDSSGGKIKATDEHPFWVESEKRWVKAVDLKPSYRFLTADNRSAEVTGTRSWSGIQKVHNFTVDGLHTYFVASSREAAPLLVHNDDDESVTGCENLESADPLQHLALGINKHGLKDFAEEVGAKHLMGTTGWKSVVHATVANLGSGSKISFLLDGLDGAGQGYERASEVAEEKVKAGSKYATEWELAEVRQHGKLDEVEFYGTSRKTGEWERVKPKRRK